MLKNIKNIFIIIKLQYVIQTGEKNIIKRN